MEINARRRDAANGRPERNNNRADRPQAAGNVSGDRSTANGASQAQGAGGSYGGRDSSVGDAFADMQRRLAAAENAMADMQGRLVAEREQMRGDMDTFFHALVNPREAS